MVARKCRMVKSLAIGLRVRRPLRFSLTRPQDPPRRARNPLVAPRAAVLDGGPRVRARIRRAAPGGSDGLPAGTSHLQPVEAHRSLDDDRASATPGPELGRAADLRRSQA